MVAPCPRPNVAPFSPRDCAADPGIHSIIPKRASPDCNLIQAAPPPLLTSPMLPIVPPIVPPPTFGCFIPFTEASVSQVPDSFTADLQSGTVAGSSDPCESKITIELGVPPFVFDPTTNPPCGDLTITTSTINNGTGSPGLTSAINQIDTDDFGCNRNIGVTMRLPALVFDMDCAATWPEFLDCKITAEDWVNIFNKITVSQWDDILTGVTLGGGGGGGGGIVIQVTHHVSERTYLVDVYGEGQDRAATETGVEAIQLQLDDTLDTIPAGTWAIATEITREVDPQPDPPPDPPLEETVRYFQVPIWLPPGAAPPSP